MIAQVIVGRGNKRLVFELDPSPHMRKDAANALKQVLGIKK